MAKEKSKINLDAILRVRKVSLSDFLVSQNGETTEDKAQVVLNTFLVTEENKDAIKALIKAEKAEAKAFEESKKTRKRRNDEEVTSVPAEVQEEPKEETEIS